ncbi:MAG: hypothetical protein ACPL07_02530 [Candidatus Bathyarchaeia archaeon]
MKLFEDNRDLGLNLTVLIIALGILVTIAYIMSNMSEQTYSQLILELIGIISSYFLGRMTGERSAILKIKKKDNHTLDDIADLYN